MEPCKNSSVTGQLLKPRQSKSRPLRKMDETDSWEGYIARCSPDERAVVIWNVCRAVIAESASEAQKNMMPAGWLPSK